MASKIRKELFIIVLVFIGMLAIQILEISDNVIAAQVPVRPASAPPGVLDDLKSSVPATRRDAAIRLGSLRARDGVRGLIEALSDKEAGVREAAAFALGQIADPGATGPLLRLLGDADPEVRASTAFALGMIGDHKAIKALSDALDDAESGVRSSAIVALGLMQDAEGVDEIIDVLNDPSFDVRYDCVWSLGQIGEPDAADHLRTALVSLDALHVSDSLREAFRQAVQSSLENLQEEERDPSGRPRRATQVPAPPRGSSQSKDSGKITRPAQLKQSVQPAPTERALRARVTGVVGVRALVGMSGHPVRAYVIRRLGYGLDQRAVEAVLQYKFDPPMQAGYSQTGWVDLDVKFSM